MQYFSTIEPQLPSRRVSPCPIHAQVAALLARHLSRQLLIQQLLQHERAVVQQVQLLAAAAQADAEATLQAALNRLPGYAQQQACGADATASSSGAAPGQAVAAPSAAAGPGGQDPVATAEALQQCRQQLARLLAQVQSDTLPAHQALFAQLHGLLYGGSGSNDDALDSSSDGGRGPAAHAAGAAMQRPELTPAALQDQLAAVTEAHSKLSLAANALVSEVLDRQQVCVVHKWGSERDLQEACALQPLLADPSMCGLSGISSPTTPQTLHASRPTFSAGPGCRAVTPAGTARAHRVLEHRRATAAGGARGGAAA